MSLPPSDRTQVKRAHQRGAYDAETLHTIVDATPICHVGYVIDNTPFVTPTFHWREGDHLYWHGSSASRMIRAAENADVCLTMTLLDGFVLARSAFHHSANYRSVMAFGRAEIVGDDEKEARLAAFVDGLWAGRNETLRAMTDKELKATTVLRLPLNEASAKIRTGGPIDDEEDYALPIWAGVHPVQLATLAPVPDPRNLPGVDVPETVKSFKFEDR